MKIFSGAVGFEWDDGNRDKNFIKHGVTNEECEEVFGDERKVMREDTKHSHEEVRHYLIGQTKKGRVLFVSFTIRKNRIRVISARDIKRKEHTYYEQ